MATTEEITLTKRQEGMMLDMLQEMAAADNEIKQLVCIQKHIKRIWGAARLEAIEDLAKKGLADAKH